MITSILVLQSKDSKLLKQSNKPCFISAKMKTSRFYVFIYPDVSVSFRERRANSSFLKFYVYVPTHYCM